MSHIKFSVKSAHPSTSTNGTAGGSARGPMAELETKIVNHILSTLKSEEQMKLIIQQANWRSQNPLKGERVSRPRNPYILFRTIYVKSLQTLYPKEYGRFDQKEGSRDIGRIWKSLSDEDQLPFNELAEIEKSEHRKCHPTYRFKHSKPTNGGRKKTAYEEMGSFKMTDAPGIGSGSGGVYPTWYDNAFSTPSNNGKAGAGGGHANDDQQPVYNATIIPPKYNEKACVQATGSQWRIIKPPPPSSIKDDGSSYSTFQLRPVVDEEGRKRRREDSDPAYPQHMHYHPSNPPHSLRHHRQPPPNPASQKQQQQQQQQQQQHHQQQQQPRYPPPPHQQQSLPPPPPPPHAQPSHAQPSHRDTLPPPPASLSSPSPTTTTRRSPLPLPPATLTSISKPPPPPSLAQVAVAAPPAKALPLPKPRGVRHSPSRKSTRRDTAASVVPMDVDVDVDEEEHAEVVPVPVTINSDVESEDGM